MTMSPEVRFLLERNKHGACRADVGLSSDALVLAAFARETVPAERFPADTADLGRCLRTFSAAPDVLRDGMRENLAAFLRHIADRVERQP